MAKILKTISVVLILLLVNIGYSSAVDLNLTENISDKVYYYAADVNSDNKISSADYVKIKKYIMNGGTL